MGELPFTHVCLLENTRRRNLNRRISIYFGFHKCQTKGVFKQ